MKKRNILTILLGVLIFTLAFYSVSVITPDLALRYDARTYWTESQQITNLKEIFYHLSRPNFNRFVDGGYITVLGIGRLIFGNKIRFFQVLNYLFWFLSSYFIYLSLKALKSKRAKLIGLLMLSSPLYLTFSSKLYSEPYASLGTSLLIYGIVRIMQKDETKIIELLTLTLGGYVVFTTKTVFILLLIPLFMFFLFKNKLKASFSILFLTILLLPNILSSLHGGRGGYNLTIQTSKIEQKTTTIAVCSIYNLSYPAGITFAPNFQGACHKNDPSPQMSKSEANPYLIAAKKRDQDSYSLTNTIRNILQHPLKYLFVVISSMSSIVLFEGFYPAVLLTFPQPLIIIGYIFGKILLSLTLWTLFITNIQKLAKKHKIKTALWLLTPLIYFFIIVRNFPVEQRYFYPLIPYIYFIAGLPSFLGNNHE